MTEKQELFLRITHPFMAHVECHILDSANMPVLDMTVNVWVGCAVLPPGAHQYAVGGELAALYFNINSLPTSLQCWEKGSDSPQARSLLLRLPIKCPCQPSRHTLLDGSTDFIKTKLDRCNSYLQNLKL